MPDRVIILGAGGHGKVIADIVEASGDVVVGFLDDDVSKKSCGCYPVLGTTMDIDRYMDCSFIIAIGCNAIRRKIAQNLTGPYYTAVHPSAVISPSAKIAEGTVIMPFSVIHADSTIGKHCIVNTGAVVEHDCAISDYVHLSPRVALGGSVAIGEGVHVGIGACVRNNVTVCADCTVGMGAVVVKDIKEAGTYAGLPAQKLR